MSRNTYAVVVAIGGQVARETGGAGIKSVRSATGEYDVTFPEPIDDWLWLATLAPSDDFDQAAGVITAQLTTMTNDTLHIKTYNFAAAAPAAANRPFHLHVRKMNA